MFELDERLRADTTAIAELGLSLVLLMNDRTMPWLILVPRRSGVREIYELDSVDRAALMDEIAQVSGVMADIYRPDKLNVANLGNIVLQLHVHVVARYKSDRAWPGSVWGAPGAQPYGSAELDAACRMLRCAFQRTER